MTPPPLNPVSAVYAVLLQLTAALDSARDRPWNERDLLRAMDSAFAVGEAARRLEVRLINMTYGPRWGGSADH